MQRIKQQNEYEAWQAHLRDTSEKSALIVRRLEERQRLQRKINTLRQQCSREIADIERIVADYLNGLRDDLPKTKSPNHTRRRSLDRSRNVSEHHDRRQSDGPGLDRD